MDYFRGVGLEPGDHVILVTGKPSWIKVSPDEVPESYKNLHYFKDKVVREAGARVQVTLTGDLHHYCRYEADDHSQLITAGGGGAYLFPTHTMPEKLALPDEPVSYTRAARWPGRESSERMAWGALRMPLLAPGLCLIIALLHASFAAALFAALDGDSGFLVVALIGLFTLGSLSGYAAFEKPLPKFLAGAAHTALQLAPAAAIAIVAELAVDANGGWATLAVGLTAGAIGYLVGGLAFGLYLVALHRSAPKHANEAFSCQSIPDWKHPAPAHRRERVDDLPDRRRARSAGLDVCRGRRSLRSVACARRSSPHSEDDRRPDLRARRPPHDGGASLSTTEHSERVVPFTAGDGMELNLVNVTGRRPPARGPVLLVHGAGVRANIYRAPTRG